MAKIKIINAKDESGAVVFDFEVEVQEITESVTVRIPKEMVAKLKQTKRDMIAKGHKVNISDLVRSSLTKVFGG